MDESAKLLSDITIFSKYAKFIPEKNRRENWEELCERNMKMHIEKFPDLKKEIKYVYNTFVKTKKVLPSMRSLQFAGKPIQLAPSRIFNCAYCPVDHYKVFSEIMFLLLGGTGVGFSVQYQHVEKLPCIIKPTKKRRFVVGDSIEGWADAINALIKSYMRGTSLPIFDFGDIRPKGAQLVTSGGKAPGPQPLETCLIRIKGILNEVNDHEQLNTLQIHDIVCHIADAVLAGGIRRAALISFFSFDDDSMISCKYGAWWELNPQRGRANNSAVILRHRVTQKDFMGLWKKIEQSGSGEPGFYFTNDSDWLSNPCMSLDTKLLTPQGITSLRDISEGDVVWSGEKWTKVKRKWKTGNKKVFKYSTHNGYFLGTDNHEVYYLGQKVQVGKTEGIDTCLGPIPTTFKLYPTDVMDGLVLGDGTVHKASNNKVVLYIGDNDQDYHNSEISHLIKENKKGISPKAWDVHTSITHEELPLTYNRTIPKRFLEGSVNKKLGFLKGLFSANGGIVAERVQFKTTSFTLVQQVQEMLSSVGIKSSININKEVSIEHYNGIYTSRESYNLCINNHCIMFKEMIGFIQDYKMNRTVKDKQEKYNHSKIIKIEEIGQEDVYDITVEDEKHTFWTSGVLVSNCCEIALRPYQFCNLTTINAGSVVSQEDFNDRAKAAAFIGTLQASYTDFHYLRSQWKKTTEKDALVGISCTGIASLSNSIDLTLGSQYILEENKRVAALIGINPAARTTCVKPEGTASLVLGTSSGIHAWHSEYYFRRMRFSNNENIAIFLNSKVPKICEPDKMIPNTTVVSIPVKAPNNSKTREETSLEFLERVQKWNLEWIKPGHQNGNNTHNVSATVSVKADEWEVIGKWMWDNKKDYNGLSILPHDGGTYIQAPFEEITKEEYETNLKIIKDANIVIDDILEYTDNTELTSELACAGGACEL